MHPTVWYIQAYRHPNSNFTCGNSPESCVCVSHGKCRCTAEVDLARGIPCPSCSGPFRSADKLLSEEEALPAWQVGQPVTQCANSVPTQTGCPETSPSVSTSGSASGNMDACHSSDETKASSGGAAGSSDEGPGSTAAAAADLQAARAGSRRCGYIYCDMAALLAGAAEPWKCDVCGAAVADHTLEVWGR
jgi:hypothetical protein